jgi:hypothetical protein
MQTLKSISKPRFLNVKGYSREVRKAVGNVLEMIQLKQESEKKDELKGISRGSQ